MKGDDNEQGPLLGQAITQACCNEHPPTGVLIPWQKQGHTDTHPHARAHTDTHPYASICVPQHVHMMGVLH